MATPTGQDADPEMGWGVGAVAARLGIAASTLRTWERRYDVGPSRRTAGGHRRYTEADIERVVLTQMLIARGAPPSDAARVAHSLDADDLAGALASEHEQTEDESGVPEDVVAALLDAALDDDPGRIERLVADALHGLGPTRAWTEIIAPALIDIGNEWSAGRFTLEGEHMASEAIVGELRAFTRSAAQVERPDMAIILASAEDDQHSLPLFALEAALAERGVGAHVLGSQLPAHALASVAGRVKPQVIFLWASLPRSDQGTVWDVLADVRDETTVILGGPGWPRETDLRTGPSGVLETTDLRSTADRIVQAIDEREATRG